MFSADLNWYTTYGALEEADYRVLAVDHRGHGRGIRTAEPFTLEACADDAAALLAHLKIQPVLAVGYSMGGPIASLLARHHPRLVAGLVLGATALDWSTPRMKAFWRTMAALRLVLGLAPEKAWQRGLRAGGFPDSPITTWVAAELSRGNSVDLAEAGRELGRYDGRSFLGSLRLPRAVIVPVEDNLVPQRKQRELAALLGVAPREVPGSHVAITTHTEPFVAALLDALAEVEAPATLQAG
jgi:3-oxoadipate enol-lactonase